MADTKTYSVVCTLYTLQQSIARHAYSLEHTFHMPLVCGCVRYTIRAKRGGSQSSYDSGGRKALSAGATLRRYGEQALREDVRSLLKDWAELLKVKVIHTCCQPPAWRSRGTVLKSTCFNIFSFSIAELWSARQRTRPWVLLNFSVQFWCV